MEEGAPSVPPKQARTVVASGRGSKGQEPDHPLLHERGEVGSRERQRKPFGNVIGAVAVALPSSLLPCSLVLKDGHKSECTQEKIQT